MCHLSRDKHVEQWAERSPSSHQDLYIGIRRGSAVRAGLVQSFNMLGCNMLGHSDLDIFNADIFDGTPSIHTLFQYSYNALYVLLANVSGARHVQAFMEDCGVRGLSQTGRHETS